MLQRVAARAQKACAAAIDVKACERAAHGSFV
jgi:hypothetical protein